MDEKDNSFEMHHCVILQGKPHCRRERNEKATAAASTESCRLTW